jgi:N-acetylmuramic acid 6-phosphate etherase
MSLTEAESLYHDLEKMAVRQILESINAEDRKVPEAMAVAIPALEKLIEAVNTALARGGRLFYLGAGTSGRLAIVDASECPPTYGVAPDQVVGIMAGGDAAIRSSAEGAEDNATQGWQDLLSYHVTNKDFVIGIAASGRTPYVLGALNTCRQNGIKTGCVVCNANSVIAAAADYPVEILVGPEFVTGSTRMKAGTAQKLALNMISTAAMIALGRVEGNRMVHMQLSNEKLVARGADMVVAQTGLPYDEAKKLLLEQGSVKKAVDTFKSR